MAIRRYGSIAAMNLHKNYICLHRVVPRAFGISEDYLHFFSNWKFYLSSSWLRSKFLLTGLQGAWVCLCARKPVRKKNRKINICNSMQSSASMGRNDSLTNVKWLISFTERTPAHAVVPSGIQCTSSFFVGFRNLHAHEHDEDGIDGSPKKRIIYKFDRWRCVIVTVARRFGCISSVFRTWVVVCAVH